MTNVRQSRPSSPASFSASGQFRRILNLVLLILGLTVAAAGCAPSLKQVAAPEEAVRAEREKQLEIAFSTFVERQDRVFGVSHPLLVAAAELCGERVRPAYGFELHDKKLYGKVLGKEYEAVAARHSSLGDQVAVRYVHPALPAAAADLRVGDRVLAVNDQLLDKKSALEAMKILHELETPTDQPLRLRIEREGESTELAVQGVPACDYSVHLVNRDDVNAFADGKRVILMTGMVRFAQAEKELALVVGHEIAHNALGHVTKQRGNVLLGTILDIAIAGTTGVDTGGLFGELAGRAFSKGFEAEADYAGLYIVARAGHDIADAATFWRRMAAEHPGSIRKNFLATHPSTAERFVAIEESVREIEEKKGRGEPLLPEKKRSAPTPPTQADAPRGGRADGEAERGAPAQ